MSTETITILLGFLALAAGQVTAFVAIMNAMNKRFDDVNKRFDDVNKRFDDVNKRFDSLQQQIGELRERMARLEGSLDGFLAGRRDRDAA